MKIAIYGSRRQEPNKALLADFFDTMRANDVQLLMHWRLYEALSIIMPDKLDGIECVSDRGLTPVDLVISLGGDGTFLRTAMWVGSRGIPILGVNTGHLGYLTTAPVTDLPAVAKDILNKNYHVERRSLLHVCSPHLPTWPYALNEVVVSKYDTASMVTVDTDINGRPLASYRADGLIIATPTGSTAYNLSVGGPVLQPSAPVWVLSPVAAHSLGMRPLVLSDDTTITLKVDSRAQGFSLSLDGRMVPLPVNTTVVLRRAAFDVPLVCRDGYEFPSALRSKLFWGVNGV